MKLVGPSLTKFNPVPYVSFWICKGHQTYTSEQTATSGVTWLCCGIIWITRRAKNIFFPPIDIGYIYPWALIVKLNTSEMCHTTASLECDGCDSFFFNHSHHTYSLPLALGLWHHSTLLHYPKLLKCYCIYMFWDPPQAVHLLDHLSLGVPVSPILLIEHWKWDIKRFLKIIISLSL